MFGGGGGRGEKGGCQQRIEVFVKIQKKNFFFLGGGGLVGGGGLGRGVWGAEVGRFGSGGGRGIRVDVNEELKFL